MSEHATYPTRPRYFAHRYCRLLTKTCAAQEISHVAFCLCVTVAMQEDSKRYRGAVTYYNEQLMPLIGVRKWDTLDQARKRAAEYGWLHYESGGRRNPGRYWVTIPAELDDLDDAPCDESSSPVNGDNGGQSSSPENGEDANSNPPLLSPSNGYDCGDNNGDNNGDNSGDNRGEPSYLTLDPTPTPEEESTSVEPPAALLQLIDGWNTLGPSVVKRARRDPVAKAVLKGWTRAQKDTEQREALQDIPAVLSAVERALFCHGQPWFTLPWLFGRNKDGEHKIVKLLNGGYEGGSGRSKHVVGDGQRYRTDAHGQTGMF